jgi:hypothetical protein
LSKKKKKNSLPLDYGICHLSSIPVRKAADDRSEMVSQLLFGELVHVLRKKNKSWIKVQCEYDDYMGWIDPKQIIPIDQDAFDRFKSDFGVALDLSSSLSNNKQSFPIWIGSSLPLFDGISFKMPTGKYMYNGHAIMTSDRKPTVDLLMKIAMKYINAPYLWGGRTPFGIDCSGFTQVVFKLLGTRIPRDAYEQAQHGQLIDFVELSREGDLAFFENKEGRIHHVGIMYGENKIIHASGQVRIDLLDHEGIYNEDIKRYTHRLNFIRRIF